MVCDSDHLILSCFVKDIYTTHNSNTSYYICASDDLFRISVPVPVPVPAFHVFHLPPFICSFPSSGSGSLKRARVRYISYEVRLCHGLVLCPSSCDRPVIQWHIQNLVSQARPSHFAAFSSFRINTRVFILKELNAAKCEGLACETTQNCGDTRALIH